MTPHWWKEKNEKRRAALAFESARKAQTGERRRRSREQDLRDRMATYYNRQYGGVVPHEFSTGGAYRRGITINTMLNVGETLCARVCADQPKPDFLVVGGSWRERYVGRLLNKFILGEFQRLKTYEKGERCQSDIMWSDLAALKVYHDGRALTHERVLPWDIIVDERGAINGEPRTLYQRAWIAADVLACDYPDAKLAATRGALERADGGVRETDMIEVYECWHLRSGPDADDGMHCICIDGEELLCEDWKHDRFPFAFLRWTELPIGFYGQGMTEQQESMQAEFNAMLDKFSESFGLSAMRIFAEEGAIATKHVSNRPGEIIPVKPGFISKIQVSTPGSVAADAYGHAWRIQEQQYRTSGVSEMSAAGQRPTSQLSGVALRTMEDMETLRHVLNVRRYQRFVLDVAELSVIFGRECYRHNKDYKANFTGKRFVETIPWSEVAIDHYVTQLWASNILPSTPTGKLATVQDLFAAGLIDQRAALAMLPGVPDVETEAALSTIEVEYVDYLVEQIILHKRPEMYRPAVYQADLGVAVRRVGQSIMEFRMQGATEADLEDLIAWLELAQDEVVMRQQRIQELMSGGMTSASGPGAGSAGPTAIGPAPGVQPGVPESITGGLGELGIGEAGAQPPGPELGGAAIG